MPRMVWRTPALRPAGAQIYAVVRRFDEEGMTELLMAPGKLGIPGISGTRNLRDNISDLKAQARGWEQPVFLSSLEPSMQLCLRMPPATRPCRGSRGGLCNDGAGFCIPVCPLPVLNHFSFCEPPSQLAVKVPSLCSPASHLPPPARQPQPRDSPPHDSTLLPTEITETFLSL
jgi:hypothetical protein